jgi:transposase
LGVRGNHVVVSKDKGIPKGRDHINGIEGFWSYAKNWLYPYRGVPKSWCAQKVLSSLFGRNFFPLQPSPARPLPLAV